MTGTILTSKGLRLITKVLASGLPLAFSRVAVGTGTFPEGYNPFYAIGLNKYKMDGEISGMYSNGEEATIIFQIGAQPIEESFIITEVGLFAQDPDEGEVLYAYLNLSSSPEYVYATNDTVQKLVEIEFKTIIGEVEHVSVITSPNALVTKEEFKQELQKKISHDGGDISETISQFEDYTRENSTPPDARTAISRIVSGIKHSKFVEYTKAALMGLVTLREMRGLLVNHGLCTEPGKFFLDAAYGKYLTDQITQLNSDHIEYWGGVEDIEIKANTWTSCKRFITLPKGQYLLCWHVKVGPSSIKTEVCAVVKSNPSSPVIELWNSFSSMEYYEKIHSSSCYISTYMDTDFWIDLIATNDIIAWKVEVMAYQIK